MNGYENVQKKVLKQEMAEVGIKDFQKNNNQDMESQLVKNKEEQPCKILHWAGHTLKHMNLGIKEKMKVLKWLAKSFENKSDSELIPNAKIAVKLKNKKENNYIYITKNELANGKKTISGRTCNIFAIPATESYIGKQGSIGKTNCLITQWVNAT